MPQLCTYTIKTLIIGNRRISQVCWLVLTQARIFIWTPTPITLPCSLAHAGKNTKKAHSLILLPLLLEFLDPPLLCRIVVTHFCHFLGQSGQCVIKSFFVSKLCHPSTMHLPFVHCILSLIVVPLVSIIFLNIVNKCFNEIRTREKEQ